MTAAISNLTVAWAVASVGHTRTSTIPHDRLACRIVISCISYTYPSIEVGKDKVRCRPPHRERQPRNRKSEGIRGFHTSCCRSVIGCFLTAKGVA